MPPLADIKLIDITDGLSGPMATQLLSDHGLDMLRIDPIGVTRTQADLVRLRGRRSIAMDVTTERGHELALRLIADADVLLLEQGLDGRYRLDVEYATLAATNPRLILCRISGYGAEGPMAGHWAHDHLVAARYGVYNQRGWREGPTYLTANVPSLGAGLLAMQGIGTALFLRERSGHGQEVSTSLLAGALGFQPGFVSAANDGGTPAPQMQMRTPLGALPFYSLYECADGCTSGASHPSSRNAPPTPSGSSRSSCVLASRRRASRRT
jgi:crotonobetainyl-CoA:carnitine CoA-transferase CaiB-like acyl-CoA transferase